MAHAEQNARLAALDTAKEAYEAACHLLSKGAHLKATQLLHQCLRVSCCENCQPPCAGTHCKVVSRTQLPLLKEPGQRLRPALQVE